MRDLELAIGTANHQWGGQWSVMVPVYSRCPKSWALPNESSLLGRDIGRNIVERFEPDFLVRDGKAEGPKHVFGREVLSHAQLTDGPNSTPSVGVGWLEVLRGLYESEFQFEKRMPRRVCLPQIPASGRVFWEAVFGRIPNSDTAAEFSELVGADTPNANFGSLMDVLLSNADLPYHLLDHGIQRIGESRWGGTHLFFLRHDSWIDLLDFWNLRALGQRVLPLPIRKLDSSALATAAGWLRRQGTFRTAMRHYVFGRSLDMEDRLRCSAWLREALGIDDDALLLTEPPFEYWSSWESQRYSGAPVSLSVRSAWHELDDSGFDSETVRSAVPLVQPDFKIAVGGRRRVAYANEVELHLSGNRLHLADVLPVGDGAFVRAIHWRLTSGARMTDGPLVVFGGASSRDVVIEGASAESVLIKWLSVRGIPATVSDPGRHVRAMLARMGDWHIRTFASRELLSLLKRHAGGQSPVPYHAMRGVAQHAKGSKQPADDWIEQLAHRGVVRLGLSVKCTTCGRNPWFGIDVLSYELSCSYCQTPFALRQGCVPGDWSYRFVGPFDLAKETVAGLAVLLTLRALRSLEGGESESRVTAYPGLNVVVDDVPFEVDLVVLMKSHRSRAAPMPVFVEVKSGSCIEERDVRRMEKLARCIPEALVVFASLADSLSSESCERISKMVTRLENSSVRPAGANVLVLCGADLTVLGNGFRFEFSDFGMETARSSMAYTGKWADLCVASQLKNVRVAAVHID